MQASLQTKYHHIYKKTYWGQFSQTMPPEIIQHRNQLIETYNITKVYETKSTDQILNLYHFPDVPIHPYIDHPESYITQNKEIICIFSIYHSDHKTPPLPILLEYIGFQEYHKIYSESATTYIAIFGDKLHLKIIIQFLSQINKLSDKPDTIQKYTNTISVLYYNSKIPTLIINSPLTPINPKSKIFNPIIDLEV